LKIGRSTAYEALSKVDLRHIADLQAAHDTALAAEDDNGARRIRQQMAQISDEMFQRAAHRNPQSMARTGRSQADGRSPQL
jgi:hypothetical protein